MAAVLRGVRVIETASFVSGPYVGQMLGDLGADVVKVESPRGGDPFRGANGYSPHFRSYNSGKRSVAIDLSTPEAESAETVARRVRRAFEYLPPEQVMIAPDCGMKYLPRESADGKMRAMAGAAALLRRDLQ